MQIDFNMGFGPLALIASFFRGLKAWFTSHEAAMSAVCALAGAGIVALAISIGQGAASNPSSQTPFEAPARPGLTSPAPTDRAFAAPASTTSFGIASTMMTAASARLSGWWTQTLDKGAAVTGAVLSTAARTQDLVICITSSGAMGKDVVTAESDDMPIGVRVIVRLAYCKNLSAGN